MKTTHGLLPTLKHIAMIDSGGNAPLQSVVNLAKLAVEQYPGGWDDYRYKQLEQLITLIRMAGSLNNGSGIVRKIEEMDRVAGLLDHSDREAKRKSFIQFLQDGGEEIP